MNTAIDDITLAYVRYLRMLPPKVAESGADATRAPTHRQPAQQQGLDDQPRLHGGSAEQAGALVAAVLEEHVVDHGRDGQPVVQDEGSVHPVEEPAGVVRVRLPDPDPH